MCSSFLARTYIYTNSITKRCSLTKSTLVNLQLLSYYTSDTNALHISSSLLDATEFSDWVKHPINGRQARTPGLSKQSYLKVEDIIPSYYAYFPEWHRYILGEVHFGQSQTDL